MRRSGELALAIGAGVALPAAAFLWGVAEATWFILVADVLISFATLRFGLRTGLLLALAAAFGAAAGGAVLYAFAVADPSAAVAHLHEIPFLAHATIERGLAGMKESAWPLAMLKGSFTGVPYKVFAVGAGLERVSEPAFLAATVPIRLVRFTLAAIAVAFLANRLVPRLGRPWCYVLLAAFWVLFYGEFWLRWSGVEQALLR